MVSYETIGIGVLYIALLTEVHAIFLHSRQLLIMYGISKSSTLYSVHKSLNLVTFVTFRLAPLLFCCYGSYTMINKSFVILYYVLPCFTSAIFFINVVLLWRLVCSDVLVKGGKEQHILDGWWVANSGTGRLFFSWGYCGNLSGMTFPSRIHVLFLYWEVTSEIEDGVISPHASP